MAMIAVLTLAFMSYVATSQQLFEQAYIQLRSFRSRTIAPNKSTIDWDELQFKRNIDFDALMVATWIKYTGIYQFNLEYTCNYTNIGIPRTTRVGLFEYYNDTNCIGTSVQYYNGGTEKQTVFQFNFLVHITTGNDQYFLSINDSAGCILPTSTLSYPTMSLSIVGIDLDVNNNISLQRQEL
eukprot:74986_1